jgi:exodeoxyribonuclease-3
MEGTRKIISYNLNGIRAAVKKGFLDWVKESEVDVLGIQETKAQDNQLPIEELKELGYHVFSHSAEKKGYSGVAIICKEEPKHIGFGCGIEAIDKEGRVIRADFETFSFFSVYLPSGSSGDERQAFKMEVLSLFDEYINELKKEIPNLLIGGDFNICHTEIDIHNPKTNKKTSGFLPEEREWVTHFMNNNSMLDTFRVFHPDMIDRYSWWTYRMNARARNKGWRIDYIFSENGLKERLVSADILDSVVHSDHCPVQVIIKA